MTSSNIKYCNIGLNIYINLFFIKQLLILLLYLLDISLTEKIGPILAKLENLTSEVHKISINRFVY